MVEAVNKGPELHPSSSWEAQSPLEFVRDFSAHARNAKWRVWTQCMYFKSGHGPDMIQKSLFDAAKRGVDSRLTYDFLSEVVSNAPMGVKDSKETVEEVEREDRNVLHELTEAGVSVSVTNKTRIAKLLPFLKRNHMKISIIDGTAWFGGVNMESDYLSRADFMVKITDPSIVSHLARLFFQVDEEKPEKDYREGINDKFALWVDRGDIGKSLIYKKAQKMVAEAEKSIRFVSQLPPLGKMLKELIDAANRGIDVSIVIPSKRFDEQVPFPYNLLSKIANARFERVIKGNSHIHLSRFEGNNGMVHGKMIIADEKKALWGSHNFAESGVWAGTQEADLETTEQGLVMRLVGWFDSLKIGLYDLGYQIGPFYPQDK